MLQALEPLGSYLLPRSLLCGEAARLVVPPPTVAEVESAIAYHELQRRIVGVTGETEAKYKITDAGRAWLAEHA